MPRGKLTSLPKWAQDEIERLERSVQWWKEKAYETTQPEGSRIEVDWRPMEGPGRFLPNDSVLRFRFGHDRYSSERYIDVSIGDPDTNKCGLTVRGSHGLAIEPMSSNLVTVWPEDR